MDDIDVLKLDGHGLRVFLAVLEEGSMTGAALRLGLNQSTVSHAIDKLRGALHDPLFVRVGRNIVPTTYAAALESRVRSLLADLQGLPAKASFDPRRETGTVTIASNAIELTPQLLILWERLRDLAPEAGLRVLDLGSRHNAEGLLASAKADLVISAYSSEIFLPELKTEMFFLDEFEVFYDPGQRGPVTSVEDYCAAEHGVIDFGGNAPSVVELTLAERRMKRRVRLRAPNAPTLAAFIKGTEIVTTMQSRLANTVFPDLARCPVPFSLPGLNFHIMWHRRDDEDPRNQWLRNLLKSCLRDQATQARLQTAK